MCTIPQAIARLKTNLTEHVPQHLITDALRALGRSYRERTLTPVVTTYLFLRQILHGNSSVAELRRLAGLDFSEAAYCQARGRLPVAFFARLARAVTGSCTATEDDLGLAHRWRGHRTFLVDGSSFSMPDTEELRDTFGLPPGQATGCGFPTGHLLALFDAHAGYLLKVVPAHGHTHDLHDIPAIHNVLQAGDVLVGDRAFGSYAHLALARQRGMHLVCRAHQRTIVNFRPHRRHARRGGKGARGLPRSRWLKRLGRHDQVVEYYKPKQRPDWLSVADYAALPESLRVRELRYRVTTPGRRVREVTLVTTLLDARRYPKAALAELNGSRWDAEGDLKSLKQTLDLDVLRCQSVPGVLKELLVIVAVYNLVCRVRQEAARRQGEEPRRVSFADALYWLRHARPGDELPRLKVNPKRVGRAEPRVRKRRPKQFDIMRKPRAVLRQALFKKRLAA